MTAQEIKAKADVIRALISDNDLELANQKLVELTKLSLADHWDEALTISANREKLETELRNGFLTDSQAEAKRNRLIDKMLELTRAIEKGKIAPTPPPPNEDKKKAGIWWLWPLMGTLLVAALVFLYMQNDEPTKDKNPPVSPREQPKENVCDALFEKGKNQFGEALLDGAYETFVAMRKNCPNRQKEANRWLQIVSKEQAKTDTPTTTKPTNSEQNANKPTNNQSGNNAKNSAVAYDRFMNAGEAAFLKKQYDQALAHYRAAQKIDHTIEASRGAEDCLDRLYRNWFSKGMDAWNAGNYAQAVPLFEKAQKYKDFSQVQAMIKKAKRKAAGQ